MLKYWNILTMCIIILLISRMTIASESFYRYILGEKEEMIIDYDYVVVGVENEEFDNWDNLYYSENALDDSEMPIRVYGLSFRLKVNSQSDVDSLVSLLANRAGIKEANYVFKTRGGENYYLGNGIMAKFKKCLKANYRLYSQC